MGLLDLHTHQLQSFLVVAESRSFTSAAEKLGELDKLLRGRNQVIGKVICHGRVARFMADISRNLY